MTLKSLYSKFIMGICENKYSEADQILDTILTEKVRTKVKKAAKKAMCCDKCRKGKKCCDDKK